MRRILLAIFVIIIFEVNFVEAQSCLNINSNPDINMSCLISCFDVNVKVPDIRSSNTYQVLTIPYNPLPYTTAVGIESPQVYADDNFSSTQNIPFDFCFYGSTYNQFVVGSNGVITFDVATNQSTEESYVLNSSNTLPYSGGVPNDINTFYAPRASIYLAYYDMDPRLGQSPPERKIEWRVEGTAPCRKLVVSFFHIGYFNQGGCQNTNNLATMQAILYEGSGIIDVFYEKKPSCSGYQGGLSIAGIQNWAQDDAIPLPGKNCTVWTALNEGYRYVPNGGTSLLNRVELQRNGTTIATGVLTPNGLGEVDVAFTPQVCQPEDSMQYVVKAYYGRCDNPSIEAEVTDTIIRYKRITPFTTSYTKTDALCNGGNGSITVTAPLGAQYEYSIDGITWQSSPIFPTVPAGIYNLTARLIASFCANRTTVTINEPTVLTLTAIQSLQTNCSNKTGEITLTAGGGTPAYEYSIDGGITYQPTNIFGSLPRGFYNNIRIKDANSCTRTHPPVEVELRDSMRLELGPDSTICVGNSVVFQPQTNAETDTFKWQPAKWLDYDTAKNAITTPTDTIGYRLNAKWGLCSRTDTITIFVLHKPIPNAGLDTTVCYKTIAYLNGSASNLSGSVNYAWAPSTLAVPNNTANAIAYPDTSRYFYLTVTDNYGCNFSVVDSVKITMRDPVPAFAGNDTIAMYNKPHQLEATGGVGFVWTPATSLNNPFIRMPLAKLTHDQYFEVKVTDDIGCYAIDGVFLRAIEGPTYHLPNAFSPNGDGLNEVFTPIPSGIKTTDYFRVFDRYGVLMFQTQEWLKGWNGNFGGKPALAGTYVWMIKGMDVNGLVVEQKGTVILIR